MTNLGKFQRLYSLDAVGRLSEVSQKIIVNVKQELVLKELVTSTDDRENPNIDITKLKLCGPHVIPSLE